MTLKTLKVAILGAGTVGSAVIKLLLNRADDLSARAGANLEIVGVGVSNLDKPRPDFIKHEWLTTDLQSLATSADLVIELIGGIEPARQLIVSALESGATVVTGNKALLAVHGPELYETAKRHGTDLYYEAAVAGAVPVVYGLRESLAGDRVTQVLGIVNGTTNYILDEMTTNGLSFDDALKQAQDLGFAEADPTADVDGFDAAAKAAILASLAFHTRVLIDDVAIEGIRSITAADHAAASAAGFVIKLLAIATRRDDSGATGVSVRVHPALVPVHHPLASVRGSFNAVVIEAESAGRLMFYGRGAGGDPTASSVLGDVVAGASHKVGGGSAPLESAYADLKMLTAEQILTRMMIRLTVPDFPGVLASVAGKFGSHNVSIESMRQDEMAEQKQAQITIVTHRATQAELDALIADLKSDSNVIEVISTIRVEDE